MKTIEIESYMPIRDENGMHFEATKRYETYSDDQVREDDVCTMCGMPNYPECTKTCQGYQFELERRKEKESRS